MNERSAELPLTTLLLYALVVESLASVAFELLYMGANFITSLHHVRVPVGADWELGIPLLPEGIPVYWSLWGMFLAAPFILRSKERLDELAFLIVAETVVASLFFVILPTEARYPPAGALGAWEAAYRVTAGVSLRYNLFPSLHVAFAVTCALVYGAVGGRRARAAYGLWAAAIAASTLILHLHHVVDLCGGVALAWGASRYGLRLVARRPWSRSRPLAALAVERSAS